MKSARLEVRAKIDCFTPQFLFPEPNSQTSVENENSTIVKGSTSRPMDLFKFEESFSVSRVFGFFYNFIEQDKREELLRWE